MSSCLVLFSRPAHAESFLLQTTKCLVRTVFLTRCQPTVETEPPATEAPSRSLTTPQQRTDSSAETNNEASGSTQQPSSGSAYTPLPALTHEDTALLPRADTTNTAAARSAAGTYYTAGYAAFSFAPHSGQTAHASTPVEASSEGWKVAGLAWYWWIVGIALIVAGLDYAKRRVIRRI